MCIFRPSSSASVRPKGTLFLHGPSDLMYLLSVYLWLNADTHIKQAVMWLKALLNHGMHGHLPGIGPVGPGRLVWPQAPSSCA